MQNHRAVGTKYEQLAGQHLEGCGYEILEYNFHSRNGEIDIVAKHQGYIVFVEVKYRENDKAGHPLEAVSTGKQRNICKCASYYLKKHGLYDAPVRFDVVSILDKEISLIQNAFDFTI